jgi:hypothetical protein
MEAQVGKLTDAQWEEVEAVFEPFNNDFRFWLCLPCIRLMTSPLTLKVRI